MMNYWRYNDNYFNSLGVHYGVFGLLVPFIIIDLVLRGISLWKSAKKDQNVWFIALLVVNSLGILPFIYLLLNRDERKPSKKIVKK